MNQRGAVYFLTALEIKAVCTHSIDGFLGSMGGFVNRINFLRHYMMVVVGALLLASQVGYAAAPTAVISKESPSGTSTSSTQITYKFVFSERLKNNLNQNDIENAGSASGVQWSVTKNTDTEYLVSTNNIGTDGTINPKIPVGKIKDDATSTDNAEIVNTTDASLVVTYTAPPPPVEAVCRLVLENQVRSLEDFFKDGDKTKADTIANSLGGGIVAGSSTQSQGNLAYKRLYEMAFVKAKCYLKNPLPTGTTTGPTVNATFQFTSGTTQSTASAPACANSQFCAIVHSPGVVVSSPDREVTVAWVVLRNLTDALRVVAANDMRADFTHNGGNNKSLAFSVNVPSLVDPNNACTISVSGAENYSSAPGAIISVPNAPLKFVASINNAIGYLSVPQSTTWTGGPDGNGEWENPVVNTVAQVRAQVVTKWGQNLSCSIQIRPEGASKSVAIKKAGDCALFSAMKKYYLAPVGSSNAATDLNIAFSVYPENVRFRDMPLKGFANGAQDRNGNLQTDSRGKLKMHSLVKHRGYSGVVVVAYEYQDSPDAIEVDNPTPKFWGLMDVSDPGNLQMKCIGDACNYTQSADGNKRFYFKMFLAQKYLSDVIPNPDPRTNEDMIGGTKACRMDANLPYYVRQYCDLAKQYAAYPYLAQRYQTLCNQQRQWYYQYVMRWSWWNYSNQPKDPDLTYCNQSDIYWEGGAAIHDLRGKGDPALNLYDFKPVQSTVVGGSPYPYDRLVPFMNESCAPLWQVPLPVREGAGEMPAALKSATMCVHSKPFSFTEIETGRVALSALYLAPNTVYDQYPTDLVKQSRQASCTSQSTQMSTCWKIKPGDMPPMLEQKQEPSHSGCLKAIPTGDRYNPYVMTYSPSCQVVENSDDCAKNLAIRFSGYQIMMNAALGCAVKYDGNGTTSDGQAKLGDLSNVSVTATLVNQGIIPYTSYGGAAPTAFSSYSNAEAAPGTNPFNAASGFGSYDKRGYGCVPCRFGLGATNLQSDTGKIPVDLDQLSNPRYPVFSFEKSQAPTECVKDTTFEIRYFGSSACGQNNQWPAGHLCTSSTVTAQNCSASEGRMGSTSGNVAGKFRVPLCPGSGYEFDHVSASWSPLILDIDGFGIQVSRDFNKSVYFDIKGTGKPVAIDWPLNTHAVAFLVEPDAKGQVTSIKQLFGDYKAANGFASLAKRFDSNKDGYVDRKDAKFAKLALWFDRNRNASVEPGELRSLDEYGVEKIALKYTKPQSKGIEGRTLLSSYFSTIRKSFLNIEDHYFYEYLKGGKRIEPPTFQAAPKKAAKAKK